MTSCRGILVVFEDSNATITTGMCRAFHPVHMDRQRSEVHGLDEHSGARTFP